MLLDRPHERKEILRSAAREQIAIPHDFFIEPGRAGIDHVVPYARPGCEHAILYTSSRRQHPWPVTQRRNWPACLVEPLDELPGLCRLAEQIRIDKAARHEQSVIPPGIRVEHCAVH